MRKGPFGSSNSEQTLAGKGYTRLLQDKYSLPALKFQVLRSETVKLRVDMVRYQKHISVRKLSDFSGVAKSHIERIEANETNPSLLVMCKLARALNVPITELFTDCNRDWS